MDNDLYPVSPQTFLTASIPSLAWTLPFRVRCAVSIGEPIDIRSLVDDDNETAVNTATVHVHNIVQNHVNHARTLRGAR